MNTVDKIIESFKVEILYIQGVHYSGTPSERRRQWNTAVTLLHLVAINFDVDANVLDRAIGVDAKALK